jgi:hypothetical protein
MNTNQTNLDRNVGGSKNEGPKSTKKKGKLTLGAGGSTSNLGSGQGYQPISGNNASTKLNETQRLLLQIQQKISKNKSKKI